jgi:formylglycine-generating enzyme required for sulfatase activity
MGYRCHRVRVVGQSVWVGLLLFSPSTPALAQTCDATTIADYLQLLDNQGQPQQDAIKALAQCDNAIPDLISLLEISQDIPTQLGATDALTQIGPGAIPDLTQLLQDADTDPASRVLAIEALTTIGQNHTDQTIGVIQTLTRRQDDPQEALLVKREATLALEQLDTPPPPPPLEILKTQLSENPALLAGTLSALVLALAYLGVLLIQPRWLLWLPGQLKIPNTTIELPLGFLLWLKYRPRVLNRWVADCLPKNLEDCDFLTQTPKDLRIHIPIQVKLNDKLIEELTTDSLRPAFLNRKTPATLLLVGEGGVGKTNFAYQIARWGLGLAGTDNGSACSLCSHPMLPVLIDQELGDKSLLTAIRDQIPRNLDGSFVSDELLTALLRQKRLLVILDHVSEMSDQSYDQMQQALDKTPINALVITSRLKEKNLGRSNYRLLEPQKIKGAKLSRFIEPYLEAQGKKDLFEDDDEFLRTCRRLSKMMAATLQNATALLVRMYVDQVIFVGEQKKKSSRLPDNIPENFLLPDNIPDLMLKYLRVLNRKDLFAFDDSIRRPDDEIQHDAKVVAWVCLKSNNYRPGDAQSKDVLTALRDKSVENPEQDARMRLNYLEDPLGLLQGNSETIVKIILDPVAEYLAALHLTAYCQHQDPDQRWQEFRQTVDDDPANIPTIRGFLLAVRNCCEQERRKKRKLPEWLPDWLNDRAEFDPKAQKEALRQQRINRWIDNLYDIEDDNEGQYLRQTIQNLREQGHYAYKAIPDLLKLIKSPQRQPTLRTEALVALMEIEQDKTALCQLMQDLLANQDDAPEVRVAAIKGLLALREETEDLNGLLRRYFEDANEVGVVRVRAGEGLRQLGVLQQLLVVQVFDQYRHEIQLIDPPKTRVFQLSEEVDLVMVQIPAGRFLMGSPEGEGYSFEKPQHEVAVEAFWMGQFPITQAQYEAVMGRNPATLRLGATHPVETVSWHNAVEFCQRLSELTQQEFRLPSEAEWEYVCRAETHTPFYFGPTITTDLANYRGTDWPYGGQIISGAYGAGPQGIFREQTTPVGLFPLTLLGFTTCTVMCGNGVPITTITATRGLLSMAFLGYQAMKMQIVCCAVALGIVLQATVDLPVAIILLQWGSAILLVFVSSVLS